MSFTPIGVIVKLLPNNGAGDVAVFITSAPEFNAFGSSDLIDGTTVTDVSLRFGTIELSEDKNDLTSFSKDECEVATLLLVVLLSVVLVASPNECLPSGTDCCGTLSMDFLLSFCFLTLLSCLKNVERGMVKCIKYNMSLLVYQPFIKFLQ